MAVTSAEIPSPELRTARNLRGLLNDAEDIRQYARCGTAAKPQAPDQDTGASRKRKAERRRLLLRDDVMLCIEDLSFVHSIHGVGRTIPLSFSDPRKSRLALEREGINKQYIAYRLFPFA